MDWPRESSMLTLFGLYDGQRISVDAEGAWMSAGGERQAYSVAWWALDELIDRGWVEFGEAWNSQPVPTQKGLYWLQRWFHHAYSATKGMTLPQIRAAFQLRPNHRVFVAV